MRAIASMDRVSTRKIALSMVAQSTTVICQLRLDLTKLSNRMELEVELPSDLLLAQMKLRLC